MGGDCFAIKAYLFWKASELEAPWQVTKVEFLPEKRWFGLAHRPLRKTEFCCPVHGESEATAYNACWAEWGHLNFFSVHSLLTCPCWGATDKLTSELCDQNDKGSLGQGRIRIHVTVRGKDIISLVRVMSVVAVARLVREHKAKLWQLVHHKD